MDTKINGQILKFPIVSKISFEPLPFPEKEIERDINEILQFYKKVHHSKNIPSINIFLLLIGGFYEGL